MEKLDSFSCLKGNNKIQIKERSPFNTSSNFVCNMGNQKIDYGARIGLGERKKLW